jgi:thiosulfate/3-mercaptopyruvate sulfurtransferase
MIYTTIVSPATLDQNLNNPKWVIVDCRFSLANSDAGGYAYRHGHIPHARYAHLNKDLSSPSPPLLAAILFPTLHFWQKNWGLGA